jgi:hypothetical protein
MARIVLMVLTRIAIGFKRGASQCTPYIYKRKNSSQIVARLVELKGTRPYSQATRYRIWPS